ncbi:hypothetical protein [Clostridium sp. CCUG 7971]|uniref:hypothetical protein n=1 Tax=Clostridium sp. CCUG 7971 TaxID=2811414 RepID=UPI001ABB67ED|nr:hypothetical protein [Clostridium sp. CCUG 7971]MBO3444220.1 hypothetical protein [Clostridium sp. CCUG 7971]
MESFVLETAYMLLIVFKILVFKSFLDIYQSKKREDKEVKSSLWKFIILIVVLVYLNNYFDLNRIVILGLWSMELNLFQIIFVSIIMYFCKKNYEMNLWKSFMFFTVYENVLFITRNIIYWGLTFFCIAIGFGGDNYPGVLVAILREGLVSIILFILNLILKNIVILLKKKNT